MEHSQRLAALRVAPGTHQPLRLVDDRQQLPHRGVVQLPAPPIEAHLGRFAGLVGALHPRPPATRLRGVWPLAQDHVGVEALDLGFELRRAGDLDLQVGTTVTDSTLHGIAVEVMAVLESDQQAHLSDSTYSSSPSLLNASRTSRKVISPWRAP